MSESPNLTYPNSALDSYLKAFHTSSLHTFLNDTSSHQAAQAKTLEVILKSSFSLSLLFKTGCFLLHNIYGTISFLAVSLAIFLVKITIISFLICYGSHLPVAILTHFYTFFSETCQGNAKQIVSLPWLNFCSDFPQSLKVLTSYHGSQSFSRYSVYLYLHLYLLLLTPSLILQYSFRFSKLPSLSPS